MRRLNTIFFRKLGQKAVLWANDLLFASGFKNAPNILKQPGRRILVYHGLDIRGEKSLNARFLSAKRFQSQLAFLSEHAQIVSLEDYFQERFDAQKFTVALSFDDGYQNNLEWALPILEQYQAPATFFLTAAAQCGEEWLWTDFLDVATLAAPKSIAIGTQVFYKKKWRHTQFFEDQQGRTLAQIARQNPGIFVSNMITAFQNVGAWQDAGVDDLYWKLLNPSQIRRLAKSPLVSVGVHGQTHADLSVLPHAQACAELANTQRYLSELTGKLIHQVAYPFGAYTPHLLDFAEKIGLNQQYIIDFQNPADAQDTRLRARMGINPYISEANQWRALRDGRY